MTNRENMETGALYNPNTADLNADRAKAKDQCQEFNNMKFSDAWGRSAALRELLGKVGKNIEIQAPFWCDYGYNIEVGDNFFANHNTVILDEAKVKFGDYVFIACNCGFYTAGHPIDTKRRNEGLEYAWPITVGDNVWIGSGVQVCPGVTIGSNVVIGAGSVVTKDIPDNSVAVGNPCHVIRKITDADEDVDYLEKFKAKNG